MNKTFKSVDDYREEIFKGHDTFKYKITSFMYKYFINPLSVFSPSNILYRIKVLLFYIKNGWDYRDTWSLDSAFSDWILKKTNCLDKIEASEFEKELIKLSLYAIKNDWIHTSKDISLTETKSLEILFYYIRLLKEKDDPFANEFATWWILRLERFIEYVHGYPSTMTEEEWPKILNKILLGMKYFGDWNLGLGITVDEKEKIIDESFNLLKTHMRSLWD